MLRIKRLYTDPETIDPIEFNEGFNIVLGEEDSSSKKTNGVGKSLCVEFINFALLKQKKWSRVTRIPENIFNPETNICLDFFIDDILYTIKRSPKLAERPLLIFSDRTIHFENLDDATEFLKEKLFANSKMSYPSFRIMLGPLIRDERSEFKSLVQCYDTEFRIPENYAPHLYFFGIDIDLYSKIQSLIKEYKELTAEMNKISENVLLIRKKKVKDVRADLNQLDNEVSNIETSIDKLESTAGYEVVKDEIFELETQIAEHHRMQDILKKQLLKLKPISEKIDIDSLEISEFYNQLKAGLGDLVKRDFDEVFGFKKKIDEFQNKLLKEKSRSLEEKIKKHKDQLIVLDSKYSKCLTMLDQKGNLKSLKQTYAAFKEKSDEVIKLRNLIDGYENSESQQQTVKTKKEEAFLELQTQIASYKNIINEFEKTILEVHDFIQGNKRASFDIKMKKTKQVIDFIMRIDSDGAHSVEREKVFIYDISLLLNKKTSIRHPGMLIHDNIFEVDQDTYVRSILFLIEKADFAKGQQYILTLNADRLSIDSQEGTLSIYKIESYIRARFTKDRKFLKKSYQEDYKTP